MKLLRALASVAAYLAFAGTVHATTIIGGSALLTPASASQLETWLGEGPLTLTNIYTKSPGDTPDDFHAAADGQGRTFTVMEVSGLYDVFHGEPVLGTYIVGGYNPESWSSTDGMHFSPPYGFDAFIFNLTDLRLQRQLIGGTGANQTFNYNLNGPMFGGGFDLSSIDLYSGYAYAWSYATGTAGIDTNVFGSSFTLFNVDRLEVFDISNSVEAVPEPSTLALLGAGLVAVRARRRRTS